MAVSTSDMPERLKKISHWMAEWEKNWPRAMTDDRGLMYADILVRFMPGKIEKVCREIFENHKHPPVVATIFDVARQVAPPVVTINDTKDPLEGWPMPTEQSEAWARWYTPVLCRLPKILRSADVPAMKGLIDQLRQKEDEGYPAANECRHVHQRQLEEMVPRYEVKEARAFEQARLLEEHRGSSQTDKNNNVGLASGDVKEDGSRNTETDVDMSDMQVPF